MNTLTLQPSRPVPIPHSHDGPTLAHKAVAFTILVAASVAFVATVLWPVVTRFA